MAYYPPSQIKTNLYTGGAEFVVEKSKQEYIGYYYALSDGTFYSGKNPNNKPNDKLIYSVNVRKLFSGSKSNFNFSS